MMLGIAQANGGMNTGTGRTEAAQTHAAVREFYLALPGKTEEGWQKVAQDPRLFNRVWRRMLGLPGGIMPPDQVV